MKSIGEIIVNKGINIEYLHSSSDTNSVDGLIFPTFQRGIIDGTSPHIIELKAPCIIEEYVNLGVAWDSKELSVHKEAILSLKGEISREFQKA